MTREELSELTNAQIREHAEVQGIKLGALDNKGTMIDKILGDVAPPKAASPQEKLSPIGAPYTIDVDANGKNIGKRVNGKKYKVKIFDTTEDHNDVDIIFNGHNVRIQRGKEVILDECYVDILRNAVINTIVQDPDTGERSASERMVYPHSAMPV